MERFFWKGKIVKKKVYLERLRLQNLGRNNLHAVYSKESKKPQPPVDNEKINKKDEYLQLEGRRIVNIKKLGEQLFCDNCHSILSLKHSVDEKHHGVASVFYIKCLKCAQLSKVETDDRHVSSSSNREKYNTNSKLIKGAIDAGIGHSHINKILAGINAPPLHWSTFKAHEKEIGVEAENLSHESCTQACIEEKRLTIENLETMKSLL